MNYYGKPLNNKLWLCKPRRCRRRMKQLNIYFWETFSYGHKAAEAPLYIVPLIETVFIYTLVIAETIRAFLHFDFYSSYIFFRGDSRKVIPHYCWIYRIQALIKLSELNGGLLSPSQLTQFEWNQNITKANWCDKVQSVKDPLI